MRYDFAGETAVVTGGASGIGLACAELLADTGANVVVLDLEVQSMSEVVSLGDRCTFMSIDVTDSGQVARAISEVETRFGGIEILICSAGIMGDPLHTVDVSDDEWRRVFAVNTDAVFFCNRAVLPGMLHRGYGRVVNVASVAGKEGNPLAAAYSASKAAVIAMTKSIGKDVAESGVLVNAVAPAVIRTPLLAQTSDEHLSYMVSRIPMGRLGEPEEVANLVAFLASRQMSFATGATFDLSGGRATY